MKPLFWIAFAVMIVGILSLVVAIPSSKRDGVTVGGVSLQVETRHAEKLSPGLSVLMIAAGLGAMAVTTLKRS